MGDRWSAWWWVLLGRGHGDAVGVGVRVHVCGWQAMGSRHSSGRSNGQRAVGNRQQEIVVVAVVIRIYKTNLAVYTRKRKYQHTYGLGGITPPSLSSLSLLLLGSVAVKGDGRRATGDGRQPCRRAVVAVSNTIAAVGVGIEVEVGGRQATGHRGWGV